MDYNRKQIALKFKEFRKERGLTQKELSDILNVDIKTYQKLESLKKESHVDYNLFIKTLSFFNLNLKFFEPTIQDRIQQVIDEEE